MRILFLLLLPLHLFAQDYEVQISEGITLGINRIPKITASSFQEPNAAKNIMDYDLSTRWSANGIGEYVIFEYWDKLTFNEFQLAFLHGTERSVKFSIEFSYDNHNWYGKQSFESSGLSDELQDFYIPEVEAKYIKLIGMGVSHDFQWNSFTEVRFGFKDATKLDTLFLQPKYFLITDTITFELIEK